MMVFIPINDGTLASSTYRDKIYYNHEKSTGDETVFSIGGLNDLKTLIKIKGNHTVMLWTLLKSLPSSTGMSHPQLFKHAEPNSSGLVTMAVFNNTDHDKVLSRQPSLEQELRSIIEEGEENKLFLNPNEGIWFGKILKNKGRRIITHRHPNKQELARAKLVSSMPQTPPPKKKREVEGFPYNRYTTRRTLLSYPP